MTIAPVTATVILRLQHQSVLQFLSFGFVSFSIFLLLGVFFVAAAVRKNPLARHTTLKTLQMTTAKWLYGARDSDGGHKARMAKPPNAQITENSED